MRTLAQAGLLPTVLRLSDETETAINLADPSRVGGDGGRRLPDDHRLRGHRRRRSPPGARRSPRCSTGLGGTALGEEPGRRGRTGRFHGAVPARLAARRRRARRDARDGDVLVQPAPRLYAAVKAALTGVARRARPLVLCHISHVYETGCLALLHRRRHAGRRPAGAVAGGQGRRQRRDRSPPAPRSPTTTPSAPTTSRGSPRRSARSACGCCARSRQSSTRRRPQPRASSSPERGSRRARSVQTSEPGAARSAVTSARPPSSAEAGGVAGGCRSSARRASTAPRATKTCRRGVVGQREPLAGREARDEQRGRRRRRAAAPSPPATATRPATAPTGLARRTSGARAGSSGRSQAWRKRVGPGRRRRPRRGRRRSRRRARCDLAGPDHAASPTGRGVPQRAAEHPGDDLEVAVRVVGDSPRRAAAARRCGDQRAEPDVAPGRSGAPKENECRVVRPSARVTNRPSAARYSITRAMTCMDAAR